jgi:serine/threonine-protein kinase
VTAVRPQHAVPTPTGPPVPGGRPPTPPAGRRRTTRWWVAGATATALAVVAALVAVLLARGATTSSAAGSARTTAPAPAPAPAPATATGGTTSSAPPPAPTTARTTASGTAAAPSSPAGDLGLATPISRPACDGRWVLFLGSATDPAAYRADVARLLDGRPGAHYLLTAGGCSSLRQRMPDGSRIYAVYLGPFPDRAAACAAHREVGGRSYVKVLDDSTPPDRLWSC